MEKGRLKIWTYVTSYKIPINEANVYITNADDTFLIAIRDIDSSGETDEISIDTVDKSLSTEKGNDKPFKTVNVYVESEGYYDVLIRGVQIFSGELSLQEVQMIPLPNDFRGNKIQRIDISSQNL